MNTSARWKELNTSDMTVADTQAEGMSSCRRESEQILGVNNEARNLCEFAFCISLHETPLCGVNICTAKSLP